MHTSNLLWQFKNIQIVLECQSWKYPKHLLKQTSFIDEEIEILGQGSANFFLYKRQ